MRASGLTTNSMVMVKRIGTMANLKVSIKTAYATVKESLLCSINQVTMASSTIIKWRALASIHGLMEAITQVYSMITRCMVKESLHTVMVVNMKDNFLMTRKRDMAYSPGKLNS